MEQYPSSERLYISRTEMTLGGNISMKMTKNVVALIGTTFALMLIVACAGATPAAPGVPTPDTLPTPEPATDMIESPAPIESVGIHLVENSGSPAELVVVSGVPNGCIRYNDNVVVQNDNTITSTVTNLIPADPNISCIQMYGTNQSHTDLTGDFDPCSTYTVVVNGEKYSVQPELYQPAGTGVRQPLVVADTSNLCADPQEPVATEDREHVEAPIHDVQINVAESFPLQYFVAISVGLPNACYDFGEAAVSQEGTIVKINVTNLAPADPTESCAEIYRTIVENVVLGSDFDPSIAYTVEVNGTSYQLTDGSGSQGNAPQPVEPAVKQVPAPVESVQINITDRQTGSATLTVVSGLPSGCAKLASFETNQQVDPITVTVLNSVPADPNIMCTAIYGIVESEAKLSASYTACEIYIVEVNGQDRKVQAIDPAARCRAPETPATSQDRPEVEAPIEDVRILATKSLPPQYTAIISVGLPNACFDFDGFEVSLDGTTVRISVTNLGSADHNVMCAQLYRTVDIDVPLNFDFQPDTDYTVEVNGKTTPLTPGFSMPPPPTSGSTSAYGSRFSLTEGRTINIGDEGLVIELTSIEDSRCPANVVCVWAGQAAVNVSATMQGKFLGEQKIILEPQQSSSASTNIGDFIVTFVSLEPYPGTQGQATTQPVATLTVQPKRSSSSATSDSKATVKLTVQPVTGSPLTVRLIADVVGGEDNDKNLYCQGVTWNLGDGNQIAMMPGCIMWTSDSTFNRHWEETYTYEKTGTYAVAFEYGTLAKATTNFEL
jgi:hypothetical protein